ncbi:TIR domain-containing protein [Candidatus Leptofilum sp.]|uniref:TIR domain-containing protein n=1 Tax=Candidatus Leptofilum sp. TaxID=3241576 RepID=UPI003B5C82A8
MSEQIHVRARKFLQEFFSDEELTNFCFDYFPQVYNDFTTGMPRSQKVRMVVENSQRRGRFDELLAALERERPKSYPDHFAEQPQQIDPKPKPAETIERNPRQIFISHAHQDAAFAQKLASDLQANGWQTWMAPDNIRPGEKWVEAINRGLSESGVFVLLLTPDAVASRWVTSEMNVAIGMEHREEMRLLPLNVKSAATPALWQAYQWIRFDGNYDASLAAILSELDHYKKNEKQGTQSKAQGKQEEQILNVDSARPSTIQLKNTLSQPQTLGEKIRAIPRQVLYGVGGLILIVLVVGLWLESNSRPELEPTEVAEMAVANNEELEVEETPKPTGSSTPTNEPTSGSVVSETTSESPTGVNLCLNTFADDNDNGQYEVGEGFIGQVSFRVTKNSQVVGQAVSSGGDEPVCFDKLEPGDYQIEQIVPEWLVMTTAANISVTLVEGETIGVLFGSRFRLEDEEIDSVTDVQETAALETATLESGVEDSTISPDKESGFSLKNSLFIPIVVVVVILGTSLYVKLRKIA